MTSSTPGSLAACFRLCGTFCGSRLIRLLAFSVIICFHFWRARLASQREIFHDDAGV